MNDRPSSRLLFSRLKRTIVLVWRSAPGWTLANTVFVLIQGMLPFVSLYLLKRIIDTITTGAVSGGPLVFRQAAALVAAAAAVALIGALLTGLGRLVTEVQANTVTDAIFDLLHAKSLAVDLEYYESTSYYDTLHMAQAEAPHRAPMIVNGLVQTIRNGVSLCAVMALLFAFHWILACVLAAVAVPALWVRFRAARTLYHLRRRQTPDDRLAGYYSWLMTTDTHAKENRIFGLGPLFSRRFHELRARLRNERRRLATGRTAREVGAQTGFIAATFGLLLFMASRALRGEITLGHLVMLFTAFQRGQGFISGFLSGAAGLYENSLFVANFYTFLDLPVRIREPETPRPLPTPWQEGLRFDHIFFTYPESDRPALRDVSFVIQPGEHVALVGENGAGKTTLIKLLCRLYDPQEGRITVDDLDLRELDTVAWRRHIGVLFQDYAKYQLTARENIWLGNVSLADDAPAIEDASRLAGSDSVIRSLPHGYDTRLGKWFEEGEELSIGQWQKIALARCFLRQTELLVLDEPTSSLDAKAEHELFEHFRHLAHGRTSIIISHRMSTVRSADRIIVLDGGTVVEQGSHDLLMERQGVYARLFSMQAERYR